MGEYKIRTFSIVEHSLNLEEDAVHMCAYQCVHVHACVPWHTHSQRVTGRSSFCLCTMWILRESGLVAKAFAC